MENRSACRTVAESPPLSVVVITVYNSTHLERCLKALEDQVGAPEMEVIAVCDGRVDDEPELEKKFPKVRFHRVPEFKTQEEMRAIGAGLAHGGVVALTVDHCTPEAHWCERIMEAHRGPYAAVGGGLEKGSQPDTAINWAVHFYDYCNYGYYQNPVPRGPARDLSDGNVSYKLDALKSVADLWKDSFHVSFVNKTLLARGEKLYLSPEIIVYQNRSIEFARALQVAFRRGRVFATKRISSSTPMKRLYYTIFSSFLPLMLLGRLARNTLAKRAQLKAMARAFPFIVLLTALWSMGEFTGYVTGRAEFKLGETYD